MKFVLNKLKLIEKDKLYETRVIEYEEEREGIKGSYEEYVALSARFIDKALSLLKTKVAKNWSRFDHFLEIIYSFAVESYQDSFKSGLLNNLPAQELSSDDQLIGLKFLANNSFILKACDFVLGKKSPLIIHGEKRIEMGGYNSPNFTPIIKLITMIVTL